MSYYQYYVQWSWQHAHCIVEHCDVVDFLVYWKHLLKWMVHVGLPHKYLVLISYLKRFVSVKEFTDSHNNTIYPSAGFLTPGNVEVCWSIKIAHFCVKGCNSTSMFIPPPTMSISTSMFIPWKWNAVLLQVHFGQWAWVHPWSSASFLLSFQCNHITPALL